MITPPTDPAAIQNPGAPLSEWIATAGVVQIQTLFEIMRARGQALGHDTEASDSEASDSGPVIIVQDELSGLLNNPPRLPNGQITVHELCSHLARAARSDGVSVGDQEDTWQQLWVLNARLREQVLRDARRNQHTGLVNWHLFSEPGGANPVVPVVWTTDPSMPLGSADWCSEDPAELLAAAVTAVRARQEVNADTLDKAQALVIVLRRQELSDLAANPDLRFVREHGPTVKVAVTARTAEPGETEQP